ncbi:MAG: YIP1 family protein [Actinomycetia bacterium]|nr:YIP1 family protein [Actinomycetes bacterium]
MKLPSIIENAFRAAMLDVDFYNRAEIDTSLNIQAATVVVVANGLAGVGSAIAAESTSAAEIGIAMALGILSGVVGWLVWSFVANLVGTRVFHGTSDFGQMRRVIGFAYTPLAIGVIPWLGFIGAVWVLLAAIIAIREGMDFSTKRSVATMVTGWGVWMVTTLALNIVLGWDMRSSWPF